MPSDRNLRKRRVRYQKKRLAVLLPTQFTPARGVRFNEAERKAQIAMAKRFAEILDIKHKAVRGMGYKIEAEGIAIARNELVSLCHTEYDIKIGGGKP